MRLRKAKTEITDDIEREAVEAVRALAGPSAQPTSPPDSHFAQLIVKTNEKIDYVTSGRALSISWLARVAVPGVVAIIFFFVGLHYYKPAPDERPTQITEMVALLPADQLDSLMLTSTLNGNAHVVQYPDLFTLSNESLVEYFVSSQNTSSILETLSDQQLTDVAVILESKSLSM